MGWPPLHWHMIDHHGDRKRRTDGGKMRIALPRLHCAAADYHAAAHKSRLVSLRGLWYQAKSACDRVF
jgi:hypothetical protein